MRIYRRVCELVCEHANDYRYSNNDTRNRTETLTQKDNIQLKMMNTTCTLEVS